MKDDKFADEMLTDDELDKIAGGTGIETFDDGCELYNRGLISEEDIVNFSKVSETLHNLGYKYKYNEEMGIFKSEYNEYFTKDGVSVSRDNFWKNFDAENGTKIIR